MRLLLPSFVFALAVGLAQQEVDLRYRFAIGDESKAALSGKVWLYHYIWGGLGSVELARIEDGRAHIRLSRERLASEIRRNLHPGAYLVVLEFPGGQWYRTADLDHLSLFSRLDASLHALGKARREPSGETLLVLPPASKRRITLRFEDGRPAPGREVHVSIFISRENHCGAHEGLDLGAFRTDPRGAIEFLAPLVKLYLDAPHYEREKEYWAVNGLTVGPEPDVVVQKAWDLPKRHYELRVRAADGSPAAGVVISQTLRTRECGVST
ncbi:MAG: hypothetical protein HY238_20660, partial [Acidobacteria bacterium]|nr:hypothetical protein [Acidobacteriota bacterium]